MLTNFLSALCCFVEFIHISTRKLNYLVQAVMIILQVIDVDMCRANTYPHCHSWHACSKSCGGGTRKRMCESCVLYQDKWFSEGCNEFCHYGHSYFSGRCHCPSWRYGECCERQQSCGGTPDGIKCTECEDRYYSDGYDNGCKECTTFPDCRNLTCTNTGNSICHECIPGKTLSTDGKICIDIMSGARIKCFDTCIVVFQRRETWEDAEAVCKARGGHLFVPETSEQESSVSTYLEAVYSNGRDTNFWIGGQILETNQKQWLSDRVVNYPYLWGITKPTATDEPLCIAMDPTKSFRWTAYSCNNPSFFLCEEKTPYESRIFG